MYQKNTMRDAEVAAMNRTIFHRHTDRVRMANIAQMVNVLQAMILTDKEKMLLTPTYHVFDMYTVHHGATRLPIDLQSGEYDVGSANIQGVDDSAAQAAYGKFHLTLDNVN